MIELKYNLKMEQVRKFFVKLNVNQEPYFNKGRVSYRAGRPSGWLWSV